jgi:hypothetical protein
VGFVNYVNGVPVSIQLNQKDLMNASNVANVPKTAANRIVGKKNAVNNNNSKRMNLAKTELDKKI